MSASYQLAVDIGGTFTDSVLMNRLGEIIASSKTPTTHSNPTEGAWNGVDRVLQEAQVTIDNIDRFIHGTTLATNALIERRGATVASISTEGFRDTLEIAYERRYDQYDVMIDKPDLIVPRSRSYTIPERVTWQGSVLKPIDLSAVANLVAEFKKNQVDAVAVCLLHAYANPKHEQMLKRALLESNPDLSISLSSDVSPEAREFDRLCTTIANAYIQPMMAGYLEHFAGHFKSAGMRCPILMITASGGMTTLDTAARLPIRLVESGPAGGAVLAAQMAKQLGAESVLSFDMGGTTAKLCLIDQYRPQRSRKFEIARAARFVKGSGMPVRIPVLEMIEIGAGGGSIASVDSLGRLQVGPQSAGSEPGPAAYGKGGTKATVTDADLALGLLDASLFAEGRLPLQPQATAQAITQHIAEPLGLSVEQAAMGVSEIVNENMANAARMHAVESGKDLGARLMIAFGGNGPLHATRVARRAGIKRIIIPPDPSVGSAVGFLHAPVSFEIVKSYYTLLRELNVDVLNDFLQQLTGEATGVVKLATTAEALNHRRTAFMRYKGQGHEIEIELPERLLHSDDKTNLQNRFEQEYQKQFSRPVPGMQIEILNWGVSVSTPVKTAALQPGESVGNRVSSNSTRTITCDMSGKSIQAQLLHRADLPAGAVIHGPALIQESQTTTLVSADFSASIDTAGNIHLQRTEPKVTVA
ncbi:methylhydantoinase [Chromatiales bacterium (ex Bugula neritina AB1)]|nr:methylhydantoinase [Chromatiales bacterium (ex Bugula neritina AB1)]